MSLEQAYTSTVIVFQGLSNLANEGDQQANQALVALSSLKLALDQAMDDPTYTHSPIFREVAEQKPGVKEASQLSATGETAEVVKKHATTLLNMNF